MREQGEEVDQLWDRICFWNLVRCSSSLSFGIILFGLFFPLMILMLLCFSLLLLDMLAVV